MHRFFALTSSLTFALLLTTACGGDDGSEESTDSNAESAEEAGETADETDTGGDTGGEDVCGSEWAEKDGTTTSIMDDWGLPCLSDDECVTALGDGATCVLNILGVYELPGGYCSKLGCELPDNQTTVLLDAPDCDANGGVACVGVAGTYTVCAEPCSTSSECGREGYGCRIMPLIGQEDDQTFCLMDPVDCCLEDDICGG
ncbi:hypothetical protein G6O69_25735 [Pseudenhygromyxa sp. WMMC2535]|uniref:hypothetical protein n=1 Tax=Pseudenhygromyxa sp. WMMC2535 TaxID=2712867 RepID=UPI00155287C4|nr:hypothetical protein [Pseudenhygromyxa sp. WMMC2535]NVB41267.1 hypothetical protein [Pseudenhygromyxa sp. WMMC2535]